MLQKIKKIVNGTLLVFTSYIVVGLVIHHWILPLKSPKYEDYFQIGKSYSSKLEGIKQTIVKLEENKLTTDITLYPKTNGPVVHFHENFDETFTVKSGTLSMEFGSEIKKLTAGQTLVIPKNTPHRPFNETDSLVIVTSEMPADFAFCLSQIYPFWDENINNSKPPKILFQLAVFGDKFDSYPTINAPPKPILKTLKFLLAPTARLLGFKNYNQVYNPK